MRLRVFDFVSLANVCHKLKLCISLNVNVAVVCVVCARPAADVELAGKAGRIIRLRGGRIESDSGTAVGAPADESAEIPAGTAADEPPAVGTVADEPPAPGTVADELPAGRDVAAPATPDEPLT